MIIDNIDQLRLTVKVNASADFAVFAPYLRMARDVYLVRYLGEPLVSLLEERVVPERALPLLEKVRMCLGPMALWAGGAELSVRLGDGGFAVEKRDGAGGGPAYVPASDAKLARVGESLERRAFHYLDLVLEWLEAHADDFPEWRDSRYYTLRGGCFIRSAAQFQEVGLVDIGYSRLTFEHLRGVMVMVEARFVEPLLGLPLCFPAGQAGRGARLGAAGRGGGAAGPPPRGREGGRAAHQRAQQGGPRGVGRAGIPPRGAPGVCRRGDTGNWYAAHAEWCLAELRRVLDCHAAELGVEPSGLALDWNRKGRGLVCDVG